MDNFMKLMVPDESPTSSPLAPVATLAFIDLETTGLPFDVGKKNVQITELSIIAIDRTDFEEDPCMRITNKINIFIRPRVPISYGAMAVTGLYNDFLERQKPFDSTVSEMLTLFFKRLRSPICLLAHNGSRFDFPVLQAELQRLSLSLPDDITCADTLVAFRSGELEACIDEQLLVEGAKIEAETVVNDAAVVQADVDYDKLLNDEMEIFEKLNDHPIITNNGLQDSLKALPQDHGGKTPMKKNKNDNPPPLNYKNKISKQNRYLLPTKKLFTDHAASSKFATIISPQKKTNETSPTKNGKRRSYTLENLYIHYFGKEADGSHHALSDCVNLSKVCQKVGNCFLPWVDENQRLFANVRAMW